MTTRRLVFHFYANDNWKSSPIYEIHKYFLTKYACVFTEALFVISVDDVNNKKLILEIEHFLIDCGFKSVQFIVEENTRLYEVETFKKYILVQLDKLDGITFFGHTKGTNDYFNPKMDKEAVRLWISSMYYLNLEFWKEAEWAAYSAKSYFFGGPMVSYDAQIKIYVPKNLFMYTGTFYWMNCKEIYNKFSEKLPDVVDRYYAEQLPGNICKKYDYEACSHNYMMANRARITGEMFDSEHMAMQYIKAVLVNDGEVDAFLDEYEKLKKYLSDNGIEY